MTSTEAPIWGGEMLELVIARRGLIAAALDVARDAVSDVSETTETYRKVTEAARRLVAAEDACQEKEQAIARWRGSGA